MKLLYSVILLLVVLQLVLTESLDDASQSNTLLAKQQLLQFYAQEVNALSRETCAKFKDLSEEILMDREVQEAKTSLMQEFKRNITRFQEIYPIYTRFDLNKELLSFFSHMTINYYYQEPHLQGDAQYILQLLKRLDYDEILDQYEADYKNFALKKFVRKFEEFKSNIPSSEAQQWKNLFEWGEEMKACTNYLCLYNSFRSFEYNILTSKEKLLSYVRQQLKKMNIFYSSSAIQIVKGVLKNEKLPQLSDTVKERLIENINDYISRYDSSSNVVELFKLLPIFYRNILLQFYNNTNMPNEERQLLTNIFNEEGFTQFRFGYYKQFREFAESDLSKLFKQFKAYLNDELALKRNPLVDWFNNFRRLILHDNKIQALQELLDLQ